MIEDIEAIRMASRLSEFCANIHCKKCPFSVMLSYGDWECVLSCPHGWDLDLVEEQLKE